VGNGTSTGKVIIRDQGPPETDGGTKMSHHERMKKAKKCSRITQEKNEKAMALLQGSRSEANRSEYRGRSD